MRFQELTNNYLQRDTDSITLQLHGFRWKVKRMYKWMIGQVDKWRFQTSSAKLVTEGNIPNPVALAQAFLTWQSLETMAKREQSRHSSAVTLTPPLESFSLSGLPLPIQCQGLALSSIKAISVEVTRACRFTQGKSPRWPTPELFFFSIHGLWSEVTGLSSA